MSKPIIVQLKIYKGKQITKGESGEILNENQLIKLRHNTKEWHNFIDNMFRNGWGRATVVSVKQETERKGNEPIYTDVDSDQFSKVVDEIKGKLQPQVKVILTADQIELKKLKAANEEMQAKVDALIEASKGGDKTPKVDEERDKAKARYKVLFGKEPHHATGLAKIVSDCEEKESENK